MKKFLTVLLAAAIVFCGAAMLKTTLTASAKISPTAPTIPTAVTVTIPPDGTTNTTSPYPGGTTSPGDGTTGPSATATATKPTSGTQTAAPTAPGGSTITGTVKPDDNPDSPKTGDANGEVFVFAGFAFAGAAAAILLNKKKETN